MMKLYTSIERTIERGPLELLALARDANEDTDLAPLKQITLELEVTFEPGYWNGGRMSGHPDTWEPPMIEDLEILSVKMLTEDGELFSKDIYDTLSYDEHCHLFNECIEIQMQEEQKESEEDRLPYYDDF